MYSIANIKEWYKGKDQWLVLDKVATVEEATELACAEVISHNRKNLV